MEGVTPSHHLQVYDPGLLFHTVHVCTLLHYLPTAVSDLQCSWRKNLQLTNHTLIVYRIIFRAFSWLLDIVMAKLND